MVATLFHERLAKIAGAEEIGTFLIYIFFFTIGTSTDVLSAVVDVPVLFVLCGIMAACNIAVAVGLGFLFRRNLEEVALACNATLGGAPSAGAMAIAKGWRSLVHPGILVGIWGYVIGTPVGVIVLAASAWLRACR